MDLALKEQFGYVASDAAAAGGASAIVWPSAVGFFAAEDARFQRWIEADAEFAVRRVEAELAKPTAWTTLLMTITAAGADATAATPRADANADAVPALAGERLNVPECADHALAIVKAVGQRAAALPSTQSQLVFLRTVQLPAIAHVTTALGRRAEALDADLRGPKDEARANVMALANAADFLLNALEAMRDEPLHLRVSLELQQQQLGGDDATGSTLKGNLSRLGGILKRGRAPATPHQLSSIVSPASVLDPELERLRRFIAACTERLCDALEGPFSSACAPYLTAAARKGPQAGAAAAAVAAAAAPTGGVGAGSEQGLAPALAALTAALAQVRLRLRAAPQAALVQRLAVAAQAQLLRLFAAPGALRMDARGAQALAADCQALFRAFAPFAQRPENRFFRALKERVSLVNAPPQQLASLSRALRKLSAGWDGRDGSPEGRQITTMLEDGFGVTALGPREVMLIVQCRTDLPP
jgi:hypothetical protein